MSISIKEIQELQTSIPEFKLHDFYDDRQILNGSLHINHVHNDFPVNESFDIEIEIPEGYPHAAPIVREIGNKISAQYSHKYTNGQLCLGIEGEMILKCNGLMTLEYFINTYVIPYFFSYRYYERFDEYPFGERSHGCIGILESYAEYLNLKDFNNVYDFLGYAITHQYRGHLPCPCNSGKRIRDCHGQTLWKIRENDSIKQAIINDMEIIKKEVSEYEQHRTTAKQ